MTDHRTFLAGTGAVLLAAPLAAEAQPATISSRIGVLSPGVPGPSPLLNAFQQGLRELGHVEGQNIRLEYRFAETRLERLGVQVYPMGVRASSEFQDSFMAAAHARASALYAIEGGTLLPHRARILSLAAQHRLLCLRLQRPIMGDYITVRRRTDGPTDAGGCSC